MAYSPPPTYADPVIIDDLTKRSQFNPIWLKWFVDLTALLDASGIDHETLAGLLGGTTAQHYHLTLAQHTYTLGKYGTAPAGITLTGSPFTHRNTTVYNQSVIVSGGTVSQIDFSRDNSTFYSVGLLAGMFWLSPGDYLRVTYAVAPTMTGVPR